MNYPSTLQSSGRYLLLIVTLIFMSLPVTAQDEGPAFILARIVEVNPAKLSEFENLMAERSAAEKAHGIGFNHVFQRLRGKINTYLIISPGTGSVEPDVGLPASWDSTIQTVLDSHTVATLSVGPGTTSLESVAPPTKYMHSRLRVVMSDKTDDYERWIERSLIPKLQKLDLGDVRSSRVMLGGDTRSFVIFSFVDDWPDYQADMDPGLAKVVAAGERMVVSSMDNFYSFRDDLSFTAD